MLEDLRTKKERLHRDVFRGYSLVTIACRHQPKEIKQAVAALKKDEDELARVTNAILVLESYGI